MTRWRNPAVQELVERCVAEEGLELVDFDYRTGASSVIRVFVHHPGGVNVSDCQRLSKTISRKLEEADAIPGAWRLDVASPGLDRPLRTEADFRRAIGERVWIDLVEPWKGRVHWEGELVSSGCGSVRLTANGDGEVDLPLGKVRLGKILVAMR